MDRIVERLETDLDMDKKPINVHGSFIRNPGTMLKMLEEEVSRSGNNLSPAEINSKYCAMMNIISNMRTGDRDEGFDEDDGPPPVRKYDKAFGKPLC